ncbi:MAG: hypothetical protein CSA50_01795 [Gammaproteobacteria bacterium]|nr:MAG: hypothetical protein CSA50_01795 [Gammaproteobacteria bacterium]
MAQTWLEFADYCKPFCFLLLIKTQNPYRESKVLSKIKKNINELGILIAFLYFIDQLLKKLNKKSGLYFYYFYDQKFESKPVREPRKKVFDFYWIDKVDDMIVDLPRPRSVLNSRFQSGSRCMVAKKVDANEFLGCAWFSYGFYQEDEVNCLYEFTNSQKVWDYDIYVKPELRMSRLFLRLWQQASKSLYEDGYTSSLSRISAYNLQSIRSHEKLGATKVGWSLFFKVSHFQLMFSSKAPYLSLSYKNHGQPRLTFT